MRYSQGLENTPITDVYMGKKRKGLKTSSAEVLNSLFDEIGRCIDDSQGLNSL